MGPFTLLAILAGLMMSSAMSSGADDMETDPQDTPDPAPETPDTPEEPDVATDTGATFAFADNTVTLDLGEDETGSLAVIRYTDDESGGQDNTVSNEARFYLVPEGVDWSEADWENRFDVPGATEFGGDQYAYLLSDFEEHFGLELLGVVDFLQDPDALSGGITANAPVPGYALDANTDGDELIRFLPDDAPETRNGVEETPVATDTTGTDGSDWITSTTDGVVLDGAGGNDVVGVVGADATLSGGAGNDVLYADFASGSYGWDEEFVAENSVDADGGLGDDIIRLTGGNATGGAGDDRIIVVEGTARGNSGDDDINVYRGDAYGGQGNDTITGLIEGNAYGGDGDDRLYSFGDSTAVLYGQDGNDFLGVGAGMTGNGGAGDDLLQVAAGGTAFGGAGDDTFNIGVRAEDTETAVLTGGEGTDTYNFTLGNPFSDNDTEYLRITDFDPEEDSLMLDAGYAARVGEISIEAAADGSHTNVIVEYVRTSGNVGPEVTTAVIRLDGAPDIALDQIGVLS